MTTDLVSESPKIDFEMASKEFLARFPQYENKLLLEKVLGGLAKEKETSVSNFQEELEDLELRHAEEAKENASLQASLAKIEEMHEKEFEWEREQFLISGSEHLSQVEELHSQIVSLTEERDCAVGALTQLKSKMEAQKEEFASEERIFVLKIRDLSNEIDEMRAERFSLREKYELLESVHATLIEEHDGCSLLENHNVTLKQEIASLQKELDDALVQLAQSRTQYQILQDEMQLMSSEHVEELNLIKQETECVSGGESSCIDEQQIQSEYVDEKEVSETNETSETMKLLEQTVRAQEIDLGEFAQINEYLKAELEASATTAALKEKEVQRLEILCGKTEFNAEAKDSFSQTDFNLIGDESKESIE